MFSTFTIFTKGPKMDGGLYFDDGEVALACTAGTPMGEKLASAMEACMGTTESTTAMSTAVNRKKKTCRGRRCRSKFSKKCPSVENIKKMIGKDMEGRVRNAKAFDGKTCIFPVDLCILNKLGWVDTEGQKVEAIMTADLMTLPTEVSANLSEEKVGICAEKIVSKMSQRNKR